MKERKDELSYAEIESLYPSHHLLISPFRKNRYGELVAGKVLVAAVELDDFWVECRKFPVKDAAIRCTKPRDKDRCFLL